MNSKLQKGNAVLVVLVLAAALGVGGYYLKSSGKLNLDQKSMVTNSDNSYVLPTGSPGNTDTTTNTAGVSTSADMSLKVLSPLNGVTLKSGVITLTGKTAPGAEVFVNDQSAKADATGYFTLTITLDEGENNLVVIANDTEGNVTEQNLSVTVQTF